MNCGQSDQEVYMEPELLPRAAKNKKNKKMKNKNCHEDPLHPAISPYLITYNKMYVLPYYIYFVKISFAI